MSLFMKDVVGGKVSKEWLNRLIKDASHDAEPAERGERDKLWRQKQESYLPKKRRKKGR